MPYQAISRYTRKVIQHESFDVYGSKLRHSHKHGILNMLGFTNGFLQSYLLRIINYIFPVFIFYRAFKINMHMNPIDVLDCMYTVTHSELFLAMITFCLVCYMQVHLYIAVCFIINMVYMQHGSQTVFCSNTRQRHKNSTFSCYFRKWQYTSCHVP